MAKKVAHPPSVIPAKAGIYPSGEREIRERKRGESYLNAAVANATATTGGQECPPSVTSSTAIAIECGARHWWWRTRGGSILVYGLFIAKRMVAVACLCVFGKDS